MTKYISTFFLLLGSVLGFSQEAIFRIDSIPQQGILLNKGWKFHAGDNPDFAKPEFDDSKWGSIDPNVDIDDLPQIKKAKIGWFRIHLKIDSSLKNTILSLQTQQALAAEFYQNGVFIGNMGWVNKNPKDVQAFFSFDYYKPVIHLYTGDKANQVLAVRFAYQKVPIFQKSDLHKGLCLAVKLSRTDPKFPVVRDAFHYNNYEQRGDFDATSLDYFKSGLFFILSILHLRFYRSYRFQKANLFIGLASFLLFIFYLYQATVNKYFYYLSDISIFSNAYWFIRHPAYLLQLTAVYLIFSVRRGIIYRLIIFGVTFSLLMPYFKLGIPFFTPSQSRLLISIIIFLDVLRISIIAHRNKKDGSWIMLIGSISFIIFMIASFMVTQSPIPRHIFNNIGNLSIPISITLYLAGEFAQTSKSLKYKLVEVEQLSLEKQESLLKQNAELQAALLQGQTIERKRVAADLHDSLGSTMTSLIWTLQAIDTHKLQPEEQNVYQNLKKMLSNAYDEVRLLSHNLLPEEFEKQGLSAALQYFVRKVNQNSSIKFDLQIAENIGRLDNKIEFELYSICLELVNNIIKHSKASEAKIELSRTEKQISLIVADNGIGTFKNESDGKGMKNVKARVESLGGTWKVKSKEGLGVVNEVVLNI